VNWNVQDLLAACLGSIDRNVSLSGLPEVETIVIDNASTDGSVKMIAESYPWVTLVANSKNCGFAAANNQGIRLCRGEYILLLNPDTVMRNDSLKTLVDYLDAHPPVGAVGPFLENPDGTLQVSCYPTPTLLGESWRLLRPNRSIGHGAYPMQTWSWSEEHEVDVVQGACLMVRRQVFERVGLLDEDYFIYSEEVDLCTRIRQANWQITWVPSAKVVHFGGQSTRQVATEMFLQLYISKVIYFRKHRGAMTARFYKGILTIASLLRIVAALSAPFLRPARRQQFTRISDNYRQLLATLPVI
jgi:GT2 family glycosyltransferase